MKKLSFLLLSLGLLIAAPSLANAKTNIFACAPEWGALAQDIGGDKVEIYTASTANQDIHHMRAKPSLLAAMRKADLVICSGASLEVGWLPILINKAGSSDVQEGGIGSIMASDFVERLEVMELNPNNLILVAKVIAQRLTEIDYENAIYYEDKLISFENEWTKFIAQWEQQAANLRGQKLVVYHKSWSYLLDWLGIESIASLEPKPGIPPNAAHLEKVLEDIKDQQVLGILVAPFENKKGAKWLSEKSNIPIINLPFTVGGNDKSNDLQSLFDDTLNQLSR